MINLGDVETQSLEEQLSNRISSAPLRLDGENDWLVWQLVDSAFPTGGFAHSSGLEAAWQNGQVRHGAELLSFLEAHLHQTGHALLPFVTAAHAEPERLEEFDSLCDVFIANHVANRASRSQGQALLSTMERVFNVGQASRLPRECESTSDFSASPRGAGGAPAPLGAHFAPAFGFAFSHLGFSRETATRLFFFNQLRSLLAAAVRLNIVGPLEAQMLQHRLSERAEEIRRQCEGLSLDDLAQTSPLLDLWQGTHDRLYSRLFRS